MSFGKKVVCIILFFIMCATLYNAISDTVECRDLYKILDENTYAAGSVMAVSDSPYSYKDASVLYSVDGKSYTINTEIESTKQVGDDIIMYYHPDKPEFAVSKLPTASTIIGNMFLAMLFYGMTVGCVLIMRKLYHSDNGTSSMNMDRIIREARKRQAEAEILNLPDEHKIPERKVDTSKDYKEPWEI